MASLVTDRLSTATFASDPLERARQKSTVSYDAAVLESLRRAAQAAFEGEGEPLFGILLGKSEAEGIRVTAWTPAAGLTSGRDPRLGRAVDRARTELAGQVPVGWFRSKHHGESRLLTEELRAAGACFPGVEPLAMVLRPSSQRPLRVATYVPVAGTLLSAERPSQEFFVQPNDAVRLDPMFPQVTMTPQVVPGPMVTEDMIEPRSLRWPMTVALVALVVLGSVTMNKWQEEFAPTVAKAASSAAAESLRLAADGKQWQVQWNGAKPADRATLVVGGQTIVLDAAQFAAGRYAIPQAADDVDILLRTERQGQVSEARTRVVASANTAAANPMAAELNQVKQELARERSRRQELQARLAGTAAGQ